MFSILNYNKKVLLRDLKRHTTRRVASARSAGLPSEGEWGTPALSWPGRYPSPTLARGYPSPVLTGGTPVLRLGYPPPPQPELGYPPEMTRDLGKNLVVG